MRVIAVITDLDIIQKIFSRARPLGHRNYHMFSLNHRRCVLQFAFAVCICICSLLLHLSVCAVFRICDSGSSISFAVLATPAQNFSDELGRVEESRSLAVQTSMILKKSDPETSYCKKPSKIFSKSNFA